MLLNLFIAILIENFEELSVRNSLTNKLNKMKKPSCGEKLKILVNQCRGIKVKPERRNKRIKKLTNEEYQEMMKMKDQEM